MKEYKIKLIISIIFSAILVIIIGISIKLLLNNSEIIKKKEQQDNVIENSENEESSEKDIFSEYYEKANEKLQTLSLDEKIAQLFIVGTSQNSDIEKLQQYQFGGYLFFSDFFSNKTEEQVKKEIDNFQEASKIPLLIAVDEEGGKVVRVSNHTKLSEEPFKSPSQLYKEGGFENIKQDTIKKSRFLSNLGINLNFAPVVDISINPKDYMYDRTIKEEKEITANYAKTVINASKKCNVSYTLKHFPGYGSNKNTHVVSSIDERTYEDIYNNDLEPFRAGIKEEAEVIMVSHNTVTNIDNKNPASISKKINDLLRDDLKFSGIIITDAINMGAIQENYTTDDAIVKAILAGNDMIIISIDKSTTDKITNTKMTYETVIKSVQEALENGTINEEIIDKAVMRILAWKYYKGLM